MTKPVPAVSPAVPGDQSIKKTGRPRGPGRPPGSRDVRPLLLGLLQKYKLYPVLIQEFDAAKADMTAKERLAFSLELAKLGIAACPRNVSVEVSQPRLMIDPSLGAVPRIPLTRKRIVGELPPAVEADVSDAVESAFQDYTDNEEER